MDIERALTAISAAAVGNLDRERVAFGLSTLGPLDLLDAVYIFMGFEREADASRDWLPVIKSSQQSGAGITDRQAGRIDLASRDRRGRAFR